MPSSRTVAAARSFAARAASPASSKRPAIPRFAARCRESAAERFDVTAVAAAHEGAYREVMDRSDGS